MRTAPTSTILVAAIAALAVVATACGDRANEPIDLATDAVGTNVSGTEFWSTSVVENGRDRALVAGTRISLRFEAGELRVDAGCNNIGGAYTIDDGDVLVVDDMFSTEMGCEPDRHAQDEFVIALLTSRPRLTVEADRLTVVGDTVTAEFVDREVVEVDAPLVGTLWVVDGFFDPVAATSFAVEAPAQLEFGPEGRAIGFDGCADFDIPYQATDLAVTIAAAPDGVCSDYALAFSSVLGRGTLTFEVQGPRLTLTAEDGTGLTAVAQ